MTQKTTHIAAIRQEAADTQRRIRELLQWSEQEYAERIYEGGIAYLHAYIPGDPTGIDQLQRSKYFWNWWRNHWIERDRQFLHVPFHSNSIQEMRYAYGVVHNPAELAQELGINGTVLHHSYAVMVQVVHDNPE